MVGGPVVTNPNKRGVAYTEAVVAACGGRLPDNAFGDLHRYHRNNYNPPHKLTWWPWGAFDRREDELRWFKRTIGDGRRVVISEWGYQSSDGEARQIENTRRELDLHEAEGTFISSWFQLNDDPARGAYFGLRDGNGQWKPIAAAFARFDTNVEETDMTANTIFSRADLIPVPGRDGEYGVRYPVNSDTIFSPKRNGAHETRDLSYLGGPDETCRIDGNLLVFPNVDGERMAWRLVD
jgi:hypothetical protein